MASHGAGTSAPVVLFVRLLPAFSQDKAKHFSGTKNSGPRRTKRGASREMRGGIAISPMVFVRKFW